MFGVNKTGINFKIFSLLFIENYLYYDAIHDYLVWMKTALNPADNNQFRFRSHTGNYFLPSLGVGGEVVPPYF